MEENLPHHSQFDGLLVELTTGKVWISKGCGSGKTNGGLTTNSRETKTEHEKSR